MQNTALSCISINLKDVGFSKIVLYIQCFLIRILEMLFFHKA